MIIGWCITFEEASHFYVTHIIFEPYLCESEYINFVFMFSLFGFTTCKLGVVIFESLFGQY